MNLQLLRYFVAVAEELHFTNAARRLYMDQGALSTAIRRLERDLGVQLFTRSSRVVQLTDAGAALYPEAVLLLARADHLIEVARTHQDVAARTLRLGLFLGEHASAELTGPIVEMFRTHHPEIRVQLIDLDLLNWAPALLHRFVDAALTRGPIGHDALAVAPLFVEPRVFVVAPTHPFADAVSLRVADLEPLQRDHWSIPGSAPKPFHEFFTLGDVWDVRDLRRDVPPPRDIGEIVDQVHRGAVVGSLPLSSARLLPRNAVTSLPMVDLAGVTAVVAYRAGDPNPDIGTLIRSAQNTVRELITLVPSAHPVPDEAGFRSPATDRP